MTDTRPNEPPPKTSENRLQGLDNNARRAVNTRPYSAFIRLLKLALPLLAVGMVMVLILWPRLSAIKTEPLGKADLQALEQAETETRLLNPVYNTADDKGRPFTITADEAVQKRADDTTITLTTPSASLKDNGTVTTLTADQGQYNQTDKVMVLKNNVTLKDSNDNILETDTLTTDIKSGRAYSDSPAILTTPNGTIEGQKILIEENGQKTIFQGPAKAVITSSGSEK